VLSPDLVFSNESFRFRIQVVSSTIAFLTTWSGIVAGKISTNVVSIVMSWFCNVPWFVSSIVLDVLYWICFYDDSYLTLHIGVLSTYYHCLMNWPGMVIGKILTNLVCVVVSWFFIVQWFISNIILDDLPWFHFFWWFISNFACLI
jgi:hypothetical protein